MTDVSGRVNTPDSQAGRFFGMPAPELLGEYRLIFVKNVIGAQRISI
jgi:hypothetical protein